mmetsp:Transcript_32005/g.73636  ORF Transcript_32005/g.73636 Transcript_32005/m.73636 type:complete len:88 (+) Transcript_32005:132-395(+)
MTMPPNMVSSTRIPRKKKPPSDAASGLDRSLRNLSLGGPAATTKKESYRNMDLSLDHIVAHAGGTAASPICLSDDSSDDGSEASSGN